MWGRTAFAEVPEASLARLAELCNRIAADALPSVGALFVGWRGLEQPADPAGAATVALNVVRELRGGAHLSAVHAVGLGPHGAILSTDDPIRGGASWAEVFGWPAPHPTPDGTRRAEAEAITNRICRHAFAGLDDPTLAEFTELVTTARAAMGD